MKPYYECDGVTIYWGDCRDFTFPAAFCFADPPYLEGDFSTYLDHLLGFGRLVVTPGKVEVMRWYRRDPSPLWTYCWNSTSRSTGGAACLHIGFEPILAYAYPLRPLGNDVLKVPVTVDPRANGHPWPKPLQLMQRLLAHWTVPGETVIEPFMGSGTMLLAAKNLGRRAIGIEREEKYCELAARRLDQTVLAL